MNRGCSIFPLAQIGLLPKDSSGWYSDEGWRTPPPHTHTASLPSLSLHVGVHLLLLFLPRTSPLQGCNGRRRVSFGLFPL